MIKYSLIIPTRNRCVLLMSLLRDLSSQVFDADSFEVIVIDNGSTDLTKASVLDSKLSLTNLIYLYEPNLGLHYGRHRGLSESKGKVLVFLDDDVRLNSNFLAKLAGCFELPLVEVVVPKIVPRFNCADIPRWFRRQWHDKSGEKVSGEYSLVDLGEEAHFVSPFFAYGCALGIRKTTLESVGGFNPDGMPNDLMFLRGDGESGVARALTKKGIFAFYQPDIVVEHLVSYERLTPGYLNQRLFQQAISDVYSDIRYHSNTEAVVRIALRIIKWWLKKFFTRSCEFDFAKADGYLHGLFYQVLQIKKNPSLLGWIRKDSYW